MGESAIGRLDRIEERNRMIEQLLANPQGNLEQLLSLLNNEESQNTHDGMQVARTHKAKTRTFELLAQEGQLGEMYGSRKFYSMQVLRTLAGAASLGIGVDAYYGRLADATVTKVGHVSTALGMGEKMVSDPREAAMAGHSAEKQAHTERSQDLASRIHAAGSQITSNQQALATLLESIHRARMGTSA